MLRDNMIEREEITDPTRNSWIRTKTSTPIRQATQELHKRVPWLTGDHITTAGLIGVTLGSILAERQNTKGDISMAGKVPTFVALGLSSLCDALDGPMARIISQETPENVHSLRGQLFDNAADRAQEMAMSISRAVSAHKRNDIPGELLAYCSEVSNIAPSLTKAISESKGFVVPEAGKGLSGFFGTRVGRTITNILATVFPEPKGFPLQKVLDAISIISNSATAYDRAKTPPISREDMLFLEKKKEARIRANSDIVLSGVIILSAIITYKSLRKNNTSL